MSCKKVLVTGGAGFLGYHLVQSLISDGAHVYIVDNLSSSDGRNLDRIVPADGYTFARADVASWAPAPGVRFAEIYHAACIASPPLYQKDPLHTIQTCVTGTDRVCRLAEEHRARVVLFSTSEVYGSPEVMPQPESYTGNINNTGPRSCYDNGKRVLETIGGIYARRGVDVRIARIFNTYGPGMAADDGRVVTNFITAALADQPLYLYGDGEQTRSFCYVSDMIRGLRALMAAPASQDVWVVNLGNPDQHVTMRALATAVLTLVPGSTSTVEHKDALTDDPARRQPDIAVARAQLNWSPTIGLHEGLSLVIASVSSLLCKHL